MNHHTPIPLKKGAFYAVLASIFGMIWMLTTLSPLVADDYSYSFICFGTERVGSLADIFGSMRTHYLIWGGRVLAHGLAQLFLWLPKGVFNLANALMYLLLVCTLYRFAVPKKHVYSLKTLLGILAVLWLCTPVFGQIVFWLTGSCNYLWSITVVLAWVAQFKCHLDAPRAHGVGYTIAMTLFGVLAGAFSENGSAAGLLCVVLLMGYLWYRRIAWQPWMYASVLGGLGGWLFLILAPGNHARAAGMLTDESFFGRYYNRFINVTNMLETHCLWVILLFVVLFAIALHQKVAEKTIVLSLIFAVTALACNYAMVLSPTYPARAVMSTFCFWVAGCAVLFANIQVEWFRVLGSAALSAVLVLALFDGLTAADVIFQNSIMAQNRVADILAQKERGITAIETVAIRSVNEKSVFHIDSEDLTDAPDYWLNIVMAEYYQVDSIIATENAFYD